MLQTPKTRSVSPDINPTFQTTAGATPAAFGAGIGAAQKQAGVAIAQAGDAVAQIQQQNLDLEARQLDNQYARAIANLTFGDGTPENQGLYAQEGENAISAFPRYQEDLKKARSDVAARATSPRARSIFEAAANERDVQQIRTDGNFIVAERKKAADNVSTARMQLAQTRAAQFSNDPAIVDKQMAIVRGEIITAADRHGLTDPAVVEAKVQEGTTMVAAAAFESAMAIEDYASAKAIFSKYQAGLTGAAVTKMYAALQDGSMKVQAQALSSEAMALFPEDRLKALRWIDEHSSGKLQDNASTAARTMFADVKLDKAQRREMVSNAREDINFAYAQQQRALAEDKRVALETATNAIMGGGSYLSVPAELRNKLSLEQRNALQKTAAHIASGEPFLTDWGKYSEYTGIQDINEMAKVDLSIAFTELATRQFDVVEGLVNAARQGKGGARTPITAQQIFNTWANELGLIGVDNQVKRGHLGTMFNEQIIVNQEKNGRVPLTSEEMLSTLHKIIDQQTINDYHWWGSGRKRLDEVTVPDNKRPTLTEDFEAANGRTPTEAELVQAFIDDSNKKKK